MAGFTNTIEESVLKHVFGIATYSAPATLYAALFTTAPAEDGTGGVEASGGSYARVAITNDNTEWSWNAGGWIENINQILFPTATANWGTIVRVVLMTASSGGAIWAISDAISFDVTTGLQPFFDPGDLTFTLD